MPEPKSTAGGQHTPDLLGSSSIPHVGSSTTRHKRPPLLVQKGTQRTSQQQKAAAKKFQSPMVRRSPIVTSSPIWRLSPSVVRYSCSPRSPPVLPSSLPQPTAPESGNCHCFLFANIEVVLISAHDFLLTCNYAHHFSTW